MTLPKSPALDATFAALSDATRRAIIARLATGDATVLELAAPFDMSLPAISKHLKVLERAGLITRGRDAQRRPCSLRAAALEDVTAWAEHTRRVWEARFDRLDSYLRELQAEEPKQPPTTDHDNQRGHHGRKPKKS
jgi:DNA-binding transcriptional ArsR family regulator